MNIQSVCYALILGSILGGLVAVTAPASLALAQAKDSGVAAPKETGAAASKDVAPNTNTNPTKHRYWRHRGGVHPHYGSRRVGT